MLIFIKIMYSIYELQWYIDSAGTSSRQGEGPNSIGRQCMEHHGIYHHVADHKSRQVTADDFKKFDFIFAMDSDNMR